MKLRLIRKAAMPRPLDVVRSDLYTADKSTALRLSGRWWGQQASAALVGLGAGQMTFLTLILCHAPGRGGLMWLTGMILVAVIVRAEVLQLLTASK